MMKIISYIVLVLVLNLKNAYSFSYPAQNHTNWTRSEKLDPNGIFNLQWHTRDNEIVFRVTLNSRGFVAIGFPYPNVQIKGYDVVYAWVNDKTGKANILVSLHLRLMIL
jgi:hypothetical protein